MKVHHLNCGSLAPAGRRALNGDGGWFDRARLVCHCLLVEAPRGLVLIDTGFGTADIADPRRLGTTAKMIRPVLRTADTALRQVVDLGYSPGDVRDIVVTHLDFDHAGGLSDFPHARVHVHSAEFAAAVNPRSIREKRRYRPVQWAHNPRWVEYGMTGEEWFGFAAARNIAGIPDLMMIPLAGHTRGHVGLVVKSGDRWLVHAGDAYFHEGQMAEPYRCPRGLTLFQAMTQTRRRERLDNLARLRELRAAEDVTVFSAHSAVEFEQVKAGKPVPDRNDAARSDRAVLEDADLDAEDGRPTG